MVKLEKKLILILAAVLITGCELNVGSGVPDNEPPPRKISYEATTTIKLIREGISLPDHSDTYGKSQYELNSRNRLLIKADELSRENYNWNVDSKFKMILSLYSVDLNLNLVALSEIQLCPLEKNWMIYATWAKAHPFQSGTWGEEGGDFNRNACVYLSAYNSEVDLLDPPEDYVFPDPYEFSADIGTINSGRMQFDVTDWFLSGPFAGVENKGFILISPSEVEVFAEQSGLKPIISWSEPGSR